MKWFITGGCGFVGSALVARLSKERGHRVRVFDDLSTGSKGAIPAFDELPAIPPPMATVARDAPTIVELVEGNVTTTAAALAAMGGADIVVHLAANPGVAQSVEDPTHDFMVNAHGTLAVLEAARHVGACKFIFASSGAVVGRVKGRITEDLVTRPVAPYGASKLAGEAYCNVYNNCYNLNTTTLRFSNVYGPGSAQKGSVIAKFMRGLISGKGIEVYGDGTQTRDFIFINDLISAIICAAEKGPASNGIFQIGSGASVSINDVLTTINDEAASQGLAAPAVHYRPMPPGDVPSVQVDNGLAIEQLNWRPRMDLRTGIADTLRWFRDNWHTTATANPPNR